MARTFVRASSNYLQTSLGAVGALGPTTVAAIVKKASDPAAFAGVFDAGNFADPNDWLFYINGGDNKLAVWTGSADRFATFTVLASEGWVLIAATKTSGTTTVRFHKYVFSTNTWTHADTAGGTVANSGTPATANNIGAYHSVDGFFDGDIAAVGVWNASLSDTQIESLPFTLEPWLQANPAGLWLLDQDKTSQKVVDFSGGGANESTLSGTSVSTSSVPVFNYGQQIWLWTAAQAAAGSPAIASFDWPPIRGHHPMKFRPGSRMRRGSSLVITAQTLLASLSGSTTPVGNLSKQASKPLTGSVSPTGTLSKLAARALAGAVSPAGALLKLAAKALAGSTSPTGAIARQAAKADGGSTSPTGTLTKSAAKQLAGAISPTGTLGRALVKILTLAGGISPTGALAKLAGKTAAGSTSPTGTMGKSAAHIDSGGITPTGAISKQAAKKAGGAVTPAGTLARVLLGVFAFVTSMFGRSRATGRVSSDPTAGQFDPPDPEEL